MSWGLQLVYPRWFFSLISYHYLLKKTSLLNWKHVSEWWKWLSLLRNWCSIEIMEKKVDFEHQYQHSGCVNCHLQMVILIARIMTFFGIDLIFLLLLLIFERYYSWLIFTWKSKLIFVVYCTHFEICTQSFLAFRRNHKKWWPLKQGLLS